MIEDLELFETKSWRTKAEIGNSKYRKRFENDSTYVASVDEFRGLGVKWKKNRRKLLPWISPPNRRERENSILFSRIDRFATIYDTVDEERIVKNLDATSKQYRCIFVDDQCIVSWWNELLLSYLHHWMENIIFNRIYQCYRFIIILNSLKSDRVSSKFSVPDIKRSDCTLKKALNWKMKKSRSSIKYNRFSNHRVLRNSKSFFLSLKRAINKKIPNYITSTIYFFPF